MNGVHDLGGMHGFGPVVREQNEPVFHSDWEKRVFGMTLTAMGRRVCNVDEFRRAIERMPPAGYLAATYYEKWLYALESLLVEKGVVTREEIASGHAAAPAPAKATGSLGDGSGGVESFDNSAVKLRFDKSYKPGFKVGDRVVARNFNPEHHTRLPRYARGKRGVIRYDHGVFVFPRYARPRPGRQAAARLYRGVRGQGAVGPRPQPARTGIPRLLGGLPRARPRRRQTGRQVRHQSPPARPPRKAADKNKLPQHGENSLPRRARQARRQALKLDRARPPGRDTRR